MTDRRRHHTILAPSTGSEKFKWLNDVGINAHEGWHETAYGYGDPCGNAGAAALLFFAAYAQTPTATPSPARAGIVPAIVHSSTDAAVWMTDMAVEYAGSPLWTTLAGVALIFLIIGLVLWLRRPRKPLETRVPL
jgi:hypothetical protein